MFVRQPLSVRALVIGSGAPEEFPRDAASISCIRTNALPVCRWQSLQWQQCTNIGALFIRKRTAPQNSCRNSLIVAQFLSLASPEPMYNVTAMSAKNFDDKIILGDAPPARSLGRVGFLLLISAITAIWLGFGLFLWEHGAWPVISFGGLDVLAIYIASS